MRFGAPPPRPRTRLRDLLIAAVLLVSLQAADSFVGPGIPGVAAMKMSEDGADGPMSRAERMQKAWRLADEARKALELAKASTARAEELRRSRGAEDAEESWDLSLDIKVRADLLQVAEKCVPTWLALPWENHPFHRAATATATATATAGASKSDPIANTEVRRAMLRQLWREISPEGAALVNRTALAAGLSRIMRVPVSEQTADALMAEAGGDGGGAGLLSEGQFAMPVLAVLDREEQAGLIEEQERRVQARQRTAAQVVVALQNVTLEGGGKDAAKQLDSLKGQRAILYWNSAFVTYENTSVERMQEVTGMESPDTQLGLRPKGLIGFRYVGLRYLGVTSLTLLLWAGFFANKVLATVLFSAGLLSGALYTLSMMFQGTIDRFLRKRHTRKVKDGVDRWARRESGKLMCSYLLGMPVEAVSFPLTSRPSAPPRGVSHLRQYSVYGRREGAWDMEELQRSASRDGYLSAGLTRQQAAVHAVIHMAGIVAEWLSHGNATEGFRSVAEMERHLLFSQKTMPLGERQALARLGVVVAFRLLTQHAAALDAMVAAFKSGESLGGMIAVFEAAPRPTKGDAPVGALAAAAAAQGGKAGAAGAAVAPAKEGAADEKGGEKASLGEGSEP